MVDAVAHDKRDRAIPRFGQRPEVLAAEVAGERPAVRGAVAFAASRFDGRADGDKLGQMLAPFLPPDFQAHADNAVGSNRVRFFFHARHGKLAGMVHRLGQRFQLHALGHGGFLPADMVDAGPDHQPQRIKPGFFD